MINVAFLQDVAVYIVEASVGQGMVRPMPLSNIITNSRQSIYLSVVLFVVLLLMLWLHLRREQRRTRYLEKKLSKKEAELQKLGQELELLTKLDGLTGLYNRHYLLELVEEKIVLSPQPFALLYLDLNRFKLVNDTHGHYMGDQVLIQVARRLTQWMPEGGVLARLGGDEFAIVYDLQEAELSLQRLCEGIHALLEQPVTIGEYSFVIGVSIGVSRYPEDAAYAGELLKCADLAMYHAKQTYFSERYELYAAHFNEPVIRKRELEIDLRGAHYDQEFKVHYQPQISLRTGEVVGVEALIRWQRPDGSWVSPGEFIGIAEETGLIIPISEWVNRTACVQIVSWNRKYQKNLVMGVNISPKLIDSSDFVAKFTALCEMARVLPEWIDLEITESSAMNRGVAMEEVLMQLVSAGVSLSIDDFGTGYSSMSYIKRYDVDRLKIAKELIDNIACDHTEYLIVKAIIMMARGMDIRTIAEGVEDKEQVEILRELGCDEVQGYYFSKPVPADEFEERFLREDLINP